MHKCVNAFDLASVSLHNSVEKSPFATMAAIVHCLHNDLRKLYQR